MGQRYRVEPNRLADERTVDLRQSGAPETRLGSARSACRAGPSKDVRLDLSYEHVLAIVGKRGSGKSFTLGSFLEGLCAVEASTAIASSSKDRAALLFDTLNIFQFMTAHGGGWRRPPHVMEQAALLRRWVLEPVELDVDLWVPAGLRPGDQACSSVSVRTRDVELSRTGHRCSGRRNAGRHGAAGQPRRSTR